MINQFSFANPRASFDYSDYEQGEAEHKDDSSTPSPLLWKNMNFPMTRSASSSPRAQEIVSYRQEMMDLVRGMPESAYELSLRDLVETPRIVKNVEEAAETRQEGAKNKAEKATDRSKGGLFLKTSVPVLDGGKTKSSKSNSFAKVSPKPEAEKGLRELQGRGRSRIKSSSETSSSSRKMRGCCCGFLATNKSKSKETSKEVN
ncbi:uncharacterized protein LOC122024648 [Zingiber officinale]|uniref:Uncharacterized protein n=1 Tax=Zingiber officinale TaxID=94328 RepID=A0A8J5KDT3_ZINOF|nr:uncharacterized protein LOC122024648 [Zingiber officinale]KAG6477153.1 hypothetical protein ZIOFF_066405 [Zingiber officinale]